MITFDTFFKQMSEIDKSIQKQQKEYYRRKKKNQRIWKNIERKLNKLQGKERSNAFNILACFSLSDTPMGSSFYNKCINELSQNERKLIIGE